MLFRFTMGSKTENNFGYFVLMSNGVRDSVQALEYIEARGFFDNLKEYLSMHCMGV